MEKAKLTRYIIIGLVLVNMSMLIFLIARPGRPHGPHGGPHGKGGPKQMIIDRLHLDAEQEKKFGEMVERHQKAMFRLHDESRTMHDDLYALLKADTINQAKADEIIARIGNNQDALEKLNLAHFAEIKSLCKPDQMGDFMKLADELGGIFHKGPPPHK